MTNSNLLSTPPVKYSSGQSQSVTDGETPLKQNNASTNVFINGSHDDRKKAVRSDLGPIPEVTVDFMLEHIIPNSNIDVETTMDLLEQDGIWSESNGWETFEGLSPKKLAKKNKENETQVFFRLKEIYQSIIYCSRFSNAKERKPTIYFDQMPNSAPKSDTDVKSRPDGCGILETDQTMHSMQARDNETTSQSRDGQEAQSKKEGVHTGMTGPLNWHDIAYVEEYKLNDSIEDLNDDVIKILWSMHHVMHVDHRRRFTFGLTIENENARMWFACRQIVLVTRPFNFNTNAHQLVRLIASLAHADPVDLGYDPTMTLTRRNDGWHYDIALTTKNPDGSERKVVYKTEKVLSNTAHNLRGRATRVYLAQVDQDSNGPVGARTVVLKDSWVDAERAKEGDNLTELLEGASKEEKALFLTIYQHGIVQVNNQDDTTQGLILKGQAIELPVDEPEATKPGRPNRFKLRRQAKTLGIIPETFEPTPQEQDDPNEIRIFHLYSYTENASKPRSSTSRTSNSASGGMPQTESRNSDALPHSTHHKFKKPIVYSPKVHYRIIFEEVGESLMQLAGSAKATTKILDRVLRDITQALQYMARKGYVHRDVSAGNILWFNNCAKLSDLEFAKKYGAGVSSYVRTGTYSFMAGEVMKGKYSVVKHAARNSTQSFVHNPIHDLESLWWVGVWCLMWHYPAPFRKVRRLELPKSIKTGSKSDYITEYIYEEFDNEQLAHIELVRKHGKALFPSFHDPDDNTRTEEIHDKDRYSNRWDGRYPDAVEAMICRLDDMRQCISWAYTLTQRNLPRNECFYFTDILRIPDPSGSELEDSNEEEDTEFPNSGVKIPLHDRFIQMLDRVEDVPVEDAILWPLDSIKHYGRWLKVFKMGQYKARTRPITAHALDYDTNHGEAQTKQLAHVFINLDSNANYHDY